MTLNASLSKTELKFQVNEFQREASSKFDINYVTNSSEIFYTPYDGMIGIAPKPSRLNKPFENSQFFTDLKNNKMIDYEIVSIYTRNELGNSSIIKFGSWDQSALKSGETLKMFRLSNL